MNDRAIGLLEQYEIEVLSTRKGRGAILCDTDRGCLIFKEYQGNEKRLAIQNRLLSQLKERDLVKVEAIIPTREGELQVRDTDGTCYVLKTYREGRECNIYEKAECMEAVRVLARLHEGMELELLPGEQPAGYSQAREYEKRNRELKKVRKYLQQKSQKTGFEISLLNCYDYFLEQAFSVTEGFGAYQAIMDKEACGKSKSGETYSHGDYQYHNILFDGREWFIINFEKCIPDNPIRDLYLLLRKLLEKSNWSLSLGTDLIHAYEKEQPISALSRIDLYYRLAYPEKFWKIVNFYYNSGKAWIPGRNQEKLEKLIAQEQEKKVFLEEAFRI
ncbi:MAG: phosphotransferase [Roseburia sp.]|nr:phosphotransferase [Roseburia sp.]